MAHDHSGEHAHTTGAPPGIVSVVRSIETDDRLDLPAAGLTRLTEPLGRPGPRDFLTGAWLGHALHPLLTDFPLGAFMSATLLDLFGGRRSQAAAQGLVAFGVAMTVPTVASGLAEWRETGPEEQRVGVVHGVLNATAAGCYLRSMGPRHRGRRIRAAAWSVTGGIIATASGYLGGHLSLVRKVGAHEEAFDDAGAPGLAVGTSP